MANTDNRTGLRPKEDLLKTFTERRNHFEKLRARAAKLELKLEPVPNSIPSHGSEEEFAARCEAVKAAKRRNAEQQNQYDLEYEYLLSHLDETPSLPLGRAAVHSREKSPRARQRSEENELQPSPQLEDINVDNTPGPGTSNQQLSEICFDDVYKNGQADPKDFIVEYPSQSNLFYILRCNMCKPAPFAYTSIMMAAGRHLDIEAHGFMERSSENAIRHLGIPVLDCTKDLAATNNEAYRTWFDSPEVQKSRRKSYYKPTSTKSSVAQENSYRKKRSLRDTVSDEHSVPAYTLTVSKRRKITRPEPSSIKAGDVYCFNRRKDTYNGVIVILPLFTDWPDWKAEVLQTPEALGCWSKEIHKPPPDLFEVDSATKVPTDWAPDFRPNGPKLQQRRYPAVFIEGERWNVSCTSIGWVPLSDIALYEEVHLRDRERKGAEDYLRQRAAAQRRHEGIRADDDGADARSGVRDEEADVDEPETGKSTADDEVPVNEKHPSTQSQLPPNSHATSRQDSETLRVGAESHARNTSSVLSRMMPDNDAVPEDRGKAAAASELRVASLPSSHHDIKREQSGHSNPTRSMLGSRSPNESRRAGKRSFGMLPNTLSAAIEKSQAKLEEMSVSSDDDDNGNDDIPNEQSPFPRVQSDIDSAQQSRPSNAYRSPYMGRL